MQQASVRTDLALEAREAAGEIAGVESEQTDEGEIHVTRVRVTTPEGARALGKPVGTYVTIEQSGLCDRVAPQRDEAARCLAREISALLPLCPGGTALVVGLGNRELTPDSLGPRVARAVLVSRHLIRQLPDRIDERVRPVCALTPGVTGDTGMETSEVVQAVCRSVRPDGVIVVDALAARSTARILSTVQVSDAGVAPGSGVGNHRAALTRETLGVPVVAVGVPLVVHASTILRDALERIAGSTGAQVNADALAREADGGSLVVTPAVIDEAVRTVAALVADGVDLALHPRLTLDEIRALRA